MNLGALNISSLCKSNFVSHFIMLNMLGKNLSRRRFAFFFLSSACKNHNSGFLTVGVNALSCV